MSGNSYEGKVALITGANGAIGTATAQLLAERGAKIFAVDIPGTDWSRFKATVGGEIGTAEADVTDEAGVKSYVEAAYAKFGQIDLFFNNAGIEGKVQMLPDLEIDNLMKVLEVNVKGVVLGLKYVLPRMYAAGKGVVVNTSSVAGLTGSPGLTPYTASKHAVLGVTRTAALEAAPKGVRVACVNPGPIDSRMMNSINTGQGDEEKMHDATVQVIPMQRYGTPREVAGLVAFLGSDDASYCAGGPYSVDGALTAG